MRSELDQLKKLLWDSWDPIGVNGIDWPDDEYDSYALCIFSMLKNGSSRGQIADYLHRSVTVSMGMTANREVDAEITDAILKIHEESKK